MAMFNAAHMYTLHGVRKFYTIEKEGNKTNTRAHTDAYYNNYMGIVWYMLCMRARVTFDFVNVCVSLYLFSILYARNKSHCKAYL